MTSMERETEVETRDQGMEKETRANDGEGRSVIDGGGEAIDGRGRRLLRGDRERQAVYFP